MDANAPQQQLAFADLLTEGAAGLLLLAAGWLVLVLGAAVLDVLRDEEHGLTARLGCPARVRVVLLAGVALVIAAAAPAPAGPAPAQRTAFQNPTTGHVAPPDLPSPARPVARPADRERTPTPWVVVRRGDSLWRLSDRCRPGSSPADLVALVGRAHHANRHVIGPDPDLIRPGQELLLPGHRPAAAGDRCFPPNRSELP